LSQQLHKDPIDQASAAAAGAAFEYGSIPLLKKCFQYFQDLPVGRWKGELFQSVDRYPGNFLPLYGLRMPFGPGAKQEVQPYDLAVVIVPDDSHAPARQDLQPQLLEQLPLQALCDGLSLFLFAAGKFPVPSQVSTPRTPSNKNPAVFVDDAGRNLIKRLAVVILVHRGNGVA